MEIDGVDQLLGDWAAATHFSIKDPSVLVDDVRRVDGEIPGVRVLDVEGLYDRLFWLCGAANLTARRNGERSRSVGARTRRTSRKADRGR